MHAALRVMHWASFVVFTYVLDAGASAVTGRSVHTREHCRACNELGFLYFVITIDYSLQARLQ